MARRGRKTLLSGPRPCGPVRLAGPSRAPSANDENKGCVVPASCPLLPCPVPFLVHAFCLSSPARPSAGVDGCMGKSVCWLTSPLQCNKMQPCSHCKRRFPEPLCEYGPLRASSPSFRLVVSTSPRPLFAFPVRLPASTPRAFHFRQQARPLAQKTHKTRKAGGRTIQQQQTLSSGPHNEPEEERDDSSPQPQVPLDHAQTALIQPPPRTCPPTVAATRAACCTPSPWLLAGPLDAMGALPLVVTKQNALLIHTCRSSPCPQAPRPGPCC